MARRPRRNHSPAFKAKEAVAAIKGEKTLIELAQDFDVLPNQIEQWRDQLLEGVTEVCRFPIRSDPGGVRTKIWTILEIFHVQLRRANARG